MTLWSHQLPYKHANRRGTLSRLHIYYFDEDHRLDEEPRLNDLLQTLHAAPELVYLELAFYRDFNPTYLVPEGVRVRLSHLTELVFNCYDNTRAVDKIIRHLDIPAAAHVTIELHILEGLDPSIRDLSLAALAPNVSERFPNGVVSHSILYTSMSTSAFSILGTMNWILKNPFSTFT